MSNITRQALSKPLLGCGARARAVRSSSAVVSSRRRCCIAVAALTTPSTSTTTTPSSSTRRPSLAQDSSPSLPKIKAEGPLDLGTTLSTSVAAVALSWLAAAPAAFAADRDTAAGAAAAAATDFSKGGFAKESYYVTLGLFLLSLPGECPFVFLLF